MDYGWWYVESLISCLDYVYIVQFPVIAIDAGSISYSNAPSPAEIAVTSTGLLFVADSTSIVPLGGALQISECLGTRDNYFIDDIIVVSSGK